MTNTTINVEWFDDDTIDTINLAAKEYDFTINSINNTDIPHKVTVSITGNIENINNFIEDVEDGDVRPMSMKYDVSDNEYQLWLQQELNTIGIKYNPQFSPDVDDE